MTIAAFYEALTGVVDHQPWRERAACKGMSADLFFPKRGDTIASRHAKRVCRTCEVRAECLEAALSEREGFGVWGATSERERKRMRTVRPEPVAVLTAAELAARRQRLAWWKSHGVYQKPLRGLG